MEPLMHLKGDDIVEALLLEATDNKLGAFQTLAEEAALLSEDPTPHEAWETTTFPPDHPEDIPKPKGTAGVVDPQDTPE